MTILIGIGRELYFLFLEMAPYLLLGLFFVGLLHIFLSKDFVIKHVGDRSLLSVIKASLLGVPLPLCSCGVVPTAHFMSRNGASKSSVVSFLISTPQTGIDSIIATYGMLGPVFAIYRPLASFISGIVGGGIVHLLGLDTHPENGETGERGESGQGDQKGICKESDKTAVSDQGDCGCSSSGCSDEPSARTSCSDESAGVSSCSCPDDHGDSKKKSLVSRLFSYAFVEFFDDISFHFLAGLIISALIAFFIPEDFFSTFHLNRGIAAMLVMIIVGAPMYICATSSIPIALTLIAKGVSPGTVFVFLAVGPLTNAASLAVLSRFLSKKILAVYVGVSALLAIGAGYFLDFLFKTFSFPLDVSKYAAEGHSVFMQYFFQAAALLFLVLLLMSLYRKGTGKLRKLKKSGR